jgi:hypothetical protein
MGNYRFGGSRKLRSDLPAELALFPPLVLDRISTGWAFAWALTVANDPPDPLHKAFLKQVRKNFKPGFRPWGAR